MKLSDEIDVLGYSCVNQTAINLLAFTSVTPSLIATTSSIMTINPTDVSSSETLNQITSFSMVASTGTAASRYTLQDISTTAYCQIPYSASPSTMAYDTNTDTPNSKSYGPFTVKDCRGQTYAITSVTLPNGASLPSGIITYDSTAKTISVKITTAEFLAYVGTRNIMITATLNGQTLQPLVQLTVQPKSDLLRDPTTTFNHDTSQCDDKIYPLIYGQSAQYSLNHITVDSKDNLLLTGTAIIKPQGQNDGTRRGFVQLQDQRAATYWIFGIESLAYSGNIAQCSFSQLSGGFVYTGCMAKHPVFHDLTYTPLLVKLDYKTGKGIYLKSLPMDRTNPTLQNILGIIVPATDKVLVIYEYQLGATKSFAALKISETDFKVDYFKFYPNTVANSIQMILTDSLNSAFFSIEMKTTRALLVRRIDITTQLITKQAQLNQGLIDYQTYPCLYDNTNMIVPYIENSSPQKIHMYILDLTGLTTIKSILLTLTASTSLQQISVTSDSAKNIYLCGARSQILFVKLSSDLTTVLYEMWRSDFSSTLSTIWAVTASDIAFFSLTGVYQAGEQISTIIFKGTDKDYNCFDIPTVFSNDTTYYPTLTVLDTATVIDSVVDSPVDALLPDDNLPVIMDANVRLYTTSYSSTQTERYDIGDGRLSNKFKTFPYQNVKCAMISAYRTYNGPSIHEIKRQASSPYVIQLNTTIPQCQSRPVGIAVLAPQSDTNAYKQSFVTYDSVLSKISFSLSTSMLPQQFYLKIRFHDLETGTTSYYHDHSIMIRIVDSANLTLSKSNFDYCWQNPFPMSFGSSYYSYSMYGGGFYANSTDNNMIMVGNVNTVHSAFSNEDTYDAYVMRLSETGWVEWLDQISNGRGLNDKTTSVTMQNGYVYTFLTTPSNSYNDIYYAIIKLTYLEGKVEWARQFIIVNPLDTNNFYLLTANDMVANPRNKTQLMLSVLFAWNNNAGTFAGNIMVNDNVTHLATDFYQVIKPLANLNTVSALGQMLFDPDTNSVYAAHLSYPVSSSIQDNIIIKQSTVDGTVEWTRSYQFGSNAPSVSYILPTLAFNNVTKNLYVASTNGYANLMRFDTSGDLKKRGTVRLSNQYIQNLQIAIDESLNQIIVVTYNNYNQRIEIMTLDENFNSISQTYLGHSQMSAYYGRMIYQIGNWYYIMHDSSRFGTSYSGYNEVTLSRKSVKYDDTGKYECHTYSILYNYYTYSDYSLSNTQLAVGALVISKEALIVLDNPNIKSYQQQAYQSTKLLANPDYSDGISNVLNIPGSNSYSCAQFTGNTNYMGPGIMELDPIEVTMGSTASYTLQSSSFKQCHGQYISFGSYNLYDEAINNTRNAYNTFISISGSQVTVTTTSASAYPGFRYLVITSACAASGYQCQSNLVLPLIIWPASFTPIPKAVPTKICLAKNSFPKVLQASAYAFQFMSQADVDKDNGNFLMCGQSGIIQNINYGYNTPGYILMSDINGRIYWAYQNVHVYQYNATHYIGCKIMNDKSSIISIIFIADLKLAVVKQDYQTGKLIYMRALIGQYYSYIYSFFDRQEKAVYVSGNRQDQVYPYDYRWTLNLVKIDCSMGNPTQKWYSYLQYSYSSSSYQYFDAVFSKTKDYFYAVGGAYLYPDYQQIGKYSKSTGKRIKLVHFTPYTVTQTIFMDENDYVYWSSATSMGYYSKLLRKLDENLNQVAAVELRIDSAYVYSLPLINSMDSDDTYFYEMFAFNCYNLYWAKYKRSDLQVVSLKMNFQVFVLEDKILSFMSTYGYYSTGSWESAVDSMNKDLKNPYSCIKFNDMIINQTNPSLSSVAPYDFNSSFTQTLYQFDYRLQPFLKQYLEYQPMGERYSFSGAKQIGCPYMGPIFDKDLEDQIIVLPKSNHQYTFDWPLDCSGQDLNFTWSVDAYWTIPTFMTMTNTTSSSTLTINPKAENAGTYVVRVRFFIKQNIFHMSERTFVVEIYPETNYGSDLPNMACSQPVVPIFFSKDLSFQQLYADVDEYDESVLLCGTTKTVNVRNTSFQAAYVSVYNSNLAPKFFITIEGEWGPYLATYHCQFAYQYGKYIDGRYFFSPYYAFRMFRAFVDSNTGDQYITGYNDYPVYSLFQYTQAFVMKIDKDYNIISNIQIRSGISGYDYGIHSFLVDLSSNSYYLLTSMYYYTTSYYYHFGVSKLSSIDGSTSWAKQMRDPAKGETVVRDGYGSRDISAGLLLLQNLLGYDVQITRHSITTGSKVHRSEIGDGSSMSMWKSRDNVAMIASHTRSLFSSFVLVRAAKLAKCTNISKQLMKVLWQWIEKQPEKLLADTTLVDKWESLKNQVKKHSKLLKPQCNTNL
ncbi:UNKNOWN [Stylonychia lemnae]|uniref:Cadg multi-domain protein n=1 Tax=Stylonychia lemnae TaxID=5949 RepID=A0A077ZME8_STYLE|nr:UNKNOWN [Stylonychia lemnae]|eukprot:CDW71147.1 UNKNOWN [Stylonychia lemnae]